MSTAEYDTDVIVVGTGPMGATATLALATYGVRVQAVTRWNWLAHTPRAHITNQRAVEVLRDLGVEEEAVRYGTQWDLMGDMTIATSFAGPEIARLRIWGTGDDRHGDYVQGSPCPMIDLIQPLLEQLLVTNAARRGAQISLNTEYLGHEQDDDAVAVTLKDLTTGSVYTRRAQFLVGADGVRSQIADEIGLEIVGRHARAGHVYAGFTADLSQYAAHRPSTLNYIMNPATGYGEIGMGLLRATRPWDQWIAGWGVDLKEGEPDLDHGRALEQIRALVGDTELQAQIEWVVPWYVNQAVALSYSKGRVFCGGDAVHRHPPSSGLGSNTSMQDAFNLAWKLAFVAKGHAGRGLLDSYSKERVPVGKQVVARANQSRLDYSALRAAVAVADSDDPIAARLTRIRARTPEGARTREGLYEALKLKSYEFNAQGVELNQRYESSAVLSDPLASEEVWAQDPQLYLQATTRPGAKIPHAWLVDERGRRVSTLDVTGKGMFTVLTGLSGDAWVNAARKLDLPYVRTVVVGDAGYQDLYGYWAGLREIEEAGVLLVRPDGYIAWRISGAVYETDKAATLLRHALGTALDHEAIAAARPGKPSGHTAA